MSIYHLIPYFFFNYYVRLIAEVITAEFFAIVILYVYMSEKECIFRLEYVVFIY
jgi:hypothetical protein